MVAAGQALAPDVIRLVQPQGDVAGFQVDLQVVIDLVFVEQAEFQGVELIS